MLPAPEDVLRLFPLLEQLRTLGTAATQADGVAESLLRQAQAATRLTGELTAVVTRLEEAIATFIEQSALYRERVNAMDWTGAETAMEQAESAVAGVEGLLGTAERLIDTAGARVAGAITQTVESITDIAGEGIEEFVTVLEDMAEQVVDAVVEDVGEVLDEMLEDALEPALDALQEAIEEAVEELTNTINDGSEDTAATSELTSGVDAAAQPILPEVQRFAGMLG